MANSEPLTPEGLRGRVVLVDFWTYTCVNWLRTLPYLRAWAAKYRNDGLAVIGVHWLATGPPRSPGFSSSTTIEVRIWNRQSPAELLLIGEGQERLPRSGSKLMYWKLKNSFWAGSSSQPEYPSLGA